jgi:hypothetical protein
MILIRNLTDAELLAIYQKSCKAISMCIKLKQPITATDGEQVTLEQLQQDHDQIMRHINSRLPIAYKWELDTLTQTRNKYTVQPGNRYRHVTVKALTLQVVERNANEHNCRLYVLGYYCCRIIIKESTLLHHFTKL